MANEMNPVRTVVVCNGTILKSIKSLGRVEGILGTLGGLYIVGKIGDWRKSKKKEEEEKI